MVPVGCIPSRSRGHRKEKKIQYQHQRSQKLAVEHFGIPFHCMSSATNERTFQVTHCWREFLIECEILDGKLLISHANSFGFRCKKRVTRILRNRQRFTVHQRPISLCNSIHWNAFHKENETVILRTQNWLQNMQWTEWSRAIVY